MNMAQLLSWIAVVALLTSPMWAIAKADVVVKGINIQNGTLTIANGSSSIIPPNNTIGSGRNPTPTPVTTNTSSGSCDSSLNNFVYHPQRLQELRACITVSGTLDVVRTEADGDLHMLVSLDSQFANYTNKVNADKQQGDLVVEPVCQNAVTQADAVAACANYNGPHFEIPAIGSHVHLELTGRYVIDNQHGGWAEIHPLSVMKVLNEPGIHSAIHVKHFTASQLKELAKEK